MLGAERVLGTSLFARGPTRGPLLKELSDNDRSRTHPADHRTSGEVPQHPRDHRRNHPGGGSRPLPARRDGSRHRWPEALVLIGRTTTNSQTPPWTPRGRLAARTRPLRPGCRVGSRQAAAQRLIMWPAIPWTASLTASPSVGCAKTVRDISSAVRSHVWARLSTGSSSVTSGPTIAAPRISLC